MKFSKSLKPIIMAIMITMTSLVISMAIFKKTSCAWISFVLILTFSSGMMILFTHTASFTPNEKNKTMKKMPMTFMMMAMIIPTPPEKIPHNQSKPPMKTFSSQMTLMMMAIILIVTMVTLSNNSFNPHQSVSATF